MKRATAPACGVDDGGGVRLLAEAFVNELQAFRELIWRFAAGIGADEALTEMRNPR